MFYLKIVDLENKENEIKWKMAKEIEPARLKCERHSRISERVSLSVDGAKRNSEMIRILFGKLRNVIRHLKWKCSERDWQLGNSIKAKFVVNICSNVNKVLNNIYNMINCKLMLSRNELIMWKWYKCSKSDRYSHWRTQLKVETYTNTFLSKI